MQWLQFEAGTIDEKLYELMCEKMGMDYKHYREVKRTLFYSKGSNHGRLFWNKEINSVDILLNILKPTHEKINDFTYLYYDTFGEKEKFLNYIEYEGNADEEISPELIYKNLQKINQSNSIFSIQLLQEYLGLDKNLLAKMKRWSYRINIPGSVSQKNWSLLVPVSLEELLELEINVSIREIILNSGRCTK